VISKKVISHFSSVLLVVVFALGQVGPALAMPAGVGMPAQSSAADLQVPDSSAPIVVSAPPVCPPSIGFGETIQCLISVAGEKDTYTFSAVAGDKVLVRMNRANGSFSPEVLIKDPIGNILCDNFGALTAEIATCTLPGTATYSIQAFDHLNTGTGGYYLYLQRLNNPGRARAITTYGQDLTGQILTASEADTYTVPAVAGDKLLARMSKSSGTLASHVQIYSPAGILLCEGFGAASGDASCSAPISGTYTILAFDHARLGIGNYFIYIQRLNNPGLFRPIGFGQNLTGQILKPAEADTFTFAATAGDKVLVRMSKSTGTMAPAVALYGTDGTKLCEASNATSAVIATCSLPTTGNYSVLAFDNTRVLTGDYFVFVQRLNKPGAPRSILFGQTLKGSILNPAEGDTFTFAATAGDTLLVRMSRSTGSLGPDVEVYSPSGALLCGGFGAITAEAAGCALPATGTYSVLASDHAGLAMGDYFIFVQRLNKPGSPKPILFGQTLPGSIIDPAEADAFTFAAQAGDSIQARLTKVSGTLAPEVTLYGPDGAKLCEANNPTMAEIASCPITVDGTYTILAFDHLRTGAGTYNLYIQRLNNPIFWVKIAGNAGAAYTTLSYMDGVLKKVTANVNGSYAITVQSGWSGTVTPSRAGIAYFEPASRSYVNVIGNLTSQNYKAHPLASVVSIATQDGYLLESSENSSVGGTFNAASAVLLAGDDSLDRQYRSILSFNTASLPDTAIIDSVTLKLRKSSVGGTDPFTTHGGLAVDVRKPYFGASAALGLDDFAALPGFTTAGIVGAVPVGGYNISRLSPRAFGQINPLGFTQMRLRFQKDDNDDMSADWVAFFSGNVTVAAYRPVLEIVYHLP
jgi:hypothetical protein